MTLHYFIWKYDKWLASQMRRSLSDSQRGIFLELLFACCSEGSLPSDMDALARTAATTPANMRKAWPSIKSAFREIDGRLHNVRATEVWAEAKLLSKKRKDAAKARWADDASAYANDDHVQMQSGVQKKRFAHAIQYPITNNQKPKAIQPSSLLEALRAAGWPDGRLAPDSLQRLAEHCRDNRPDATDEEISHFVGLTAKSIGKRAKDPMAVLVSQAPERLRAGLDDRRAFLREEAQLKAAFEAVERRRKVETLRELANSTGDEKWAVEARENALCELAEMGEANAL
jgi:uncharacterized protein YdaU (DUF1376 family)